MPLTLYNSKNSNNSKNSKNSNNSKTMKLISESSVLLQEKEWKPAKPKKGEPEPPASNPEITGEATVVQSNDARLKKGDKVLINRLGNLGITIGKKKLVLTDIRDVILKF